MSIETCSRCDGNGQIYQFYAPNPKEPNVGKYEAIRCPQCNGHGVKGMI